MKKVILIFLIFSFIEHSIKGGELMWFDHATNAFYQVDLESGKLKKKEFESVWEDAGEFKVKVHNNKSYIQGFPRFSYRKGENLYLFARGIDRIFRVNQNKREIEEYVDKARRGVDFEFASYEWEEKLYKIGGVGFWNEYSQLYQYDFDLNRFNLIQTDGQPPKGVIEKFSILDSLKRRVVVMDIFEETYQNKQNELKIKALDLDTKTWEDLGMINHPILKNRFNNLNQGINNKIEGLLFLQLVEGKFILDLADNNLYEYLGNNHEWFNSIIIERFVKGGEVSFLITNPSNFDFSNNSRIQVFDKQKILKESKYRGEIYGKNFLAERKFFLHSVFLILAIGFLVYLANWRKQTEGEISMELGPNYEWELQQLRAFSGEVISTEDLNQILKIGNKSNDTQRHYRSKFILAFNKEMFLRYGVKEALFRENDPSDNRYKIYRLRNF